MSFYIIQSYFINNYNILGFIFLANYNNDNLVLCKINKDNSFACYCSLHNCPHISFLQSVDIDYLYLNSDNTIYSLPNSIFKSSSSKICSICLSKTKNYSCPICSSCFHSKCISEWLVQSKTCPNCRSNIWKYCKIK